jgi:simple sugar transport system substrate-binding protein
MSGGTDLVELGVAQDPERSAWMKARGLRLSRRALLRNAGIAAAVASVPGFLEACGGAATGAGGGGGQGSFPAHPKWNFVFVNHVTTNSFFQPTQYGIQDACALLGCGYQWTGSENSVVSEMVDKLNAAVSAKADGIAVSLVDPDAFNEPVAKALSQGIPVVSYNADVPPPKNPRLAYIGQDLYQSGFQMGQRIVNLVKQGPVAGFIATPGSLNIQPRINGASDAIKASGAPIQFSEIATGAQQAQELPAIESYYLGHKDVKGMFAVDAGSTASTAQIMHKYNLAQQGVHAGGFDLLTNTVQGIVSGDLDFTIDQQPYLQGFLPVVQLFFYKLSGGLTGPADTDTGLKFVTKQNIGPYAHTQTRFEGSSPKQQVVTSTS